MTVTDLTPDVDDPAAEPATVELRGKRFPIRDEGVSLLGLMKFAQLAKRGVSTDDADGLASLYELLRSCIAESAWPAFERHAMTLGTGDAAELMAVVRDAVKASGSRPTRRPSDSRDGRSTTGTSSAGGSSSPGSSVPMGSVDVQRDLEARGRPDVALVVMRAREASTRSSTG